MEDKYVPPSTGDHSIIRNFTFNLRAYTLEVESYWYYL